MLEDFKINFDKGNLRQYYKIGKVLFCNSFVPDKDKLGSYLPTDDWYECSKDGEPSFPCSLDYVMRYLRREKVASSSSALHNNLTKELSDISNKRNPIKEDVKVAKEKVVKKKSKKLLDNKK